MNLTNLDDAEHIPEWPKWRYYPAKLPSPDEYEHGWWTIKDHVVLYLSATFELSVREIYRVGQPFMGWTYVGTETFQWIEEEELDRFKMEDLL